MKVLFLTRYDRSGASSRLRSFQFEPMLLANGIDVTSHSLISDDLLQAKYRSSPYSLQQLAVSYFNRIHTLLSRDRFDLVWIEKEAFPWVPLWIERALLRHVPCVLDYDDAIFHNYDLHPSRLFRRFFGKRIDGLMAGATLVVCGNHYLAERARAAGAPWVEVLPTVIDLERYHLCGQLKASSIDGLPRVVWIGSPSTVRYLNVLRTPLTALAQNIPFVLRVIGGGNLDIPGVKVESIPWSELSEVKDVAGADVGIMPLLDSPWERGKCGYKLIQYMACGLPVVASPVGVNVDIVQSNINGLLANKSQEWIDALEQLLTQPQRRAAMGQAGRARVESEYCIQKIGPELVQLLLIAAGRRQQCAG